MLMILIGGNYQFEVRQAEKQRAAEAILAKKRWRLVRDSVTGGKRPPSTIKSDSQSPRDKAYSYWAFGVFFHFPIVVKTAFDVFLCQAISETQSVLQRDDRVMCEDSSHRVLQFFAIVVILMCIFLPMFVLVKLWLAPAPSSCDLDPTLAQRVAQECSETEDTAKWIIGEVTITSATGEGWHVLTDGYKDGFAYLLYSINIATAFPINCKKDLNIRC